MQRRTGKKDSSYFAKEAVYVQCKDRQGKGMDMTHKENAEVVKKYFDENDWHYQMAESEEVTFFEGGFCFYQVCRG